MKNTLSIRTEKNGHMDTSVYCIIFVACLIFLYMSFRRYVKFYYESCMIIPCLLLLGAQLENRKNPVNKKIFICPVVMVVWFLLLQGKRNSEHADLDNIGLFLSVYLVAFPLASLLQDGDKKQALKIFAGTYLAAAAVLCLEGLLLLLDCIPEFLQQDICWDGGRLNVFWHPNLSACFFMIGIVFCVTFLNQGKSLRVKAVLSALLVLMIGMLALTSSRTAIILTGAFLGSVLFFSMIQKGKKRFVLGILALLTAIVVFYKGTAYIYQVNCDVLINKYTQQYFEQTKSETEENSISSQINEETENPKNSDTGDTAKGESPIAVDAETGEIYLQTDSPQGEIVQDLLTLNSRSHIWSSALLAIRETPSILYWGIHDPGWYVSFYHSSEISHLHNAWMQCLVGLGLVGFVMAMIFTLITLWNSIMILLKHYRDVWKRNIALLALCLMIASFMEPYLFYTTTYYHLTDFLFFLCAGYLVHWQKEDNCRIKNMICSRISFLKNM